VSPPPENTKHYCVFTPDLKGNDYQVKHIIRESSEWTSHLVFSPPNTDYTYEVEYSKAKGQLRISYLEWILNMKGALKS